MKRFDEVVVGDVVMAEVDGWQDCRVLQVNEDGTLTVAPVSAKSAFLSEWIGLTEEEVLLDDRARWSAVFEMYAVDDEMGVDEFLAAFRACGNGIARESIASFLEEHRERLGEYDLEGVPRARFDEESAYKVLKSGGGTARSLDPREDAPRSSAGYFKLYWNQLRMGGRDPAQCPPVGWPEAFAALGLLSEGSSEAAAVAALESSSGARLPTGVRRFLSLAGVRRAVMKAHPNNPRLCSAESWKIWTDPAEHGMSGVLAMPIVLPYSGGHSWWITWNPGDAEAQVVIRLGRGGVRPVAPDLAFFVWDLSGTGQAWEALTGRKRGVPGED